MNVKKCIKDYYRKEGGTEMNENIKSTLEILQMLKTSTKEQREQWKQIVLDENPQMEKYVNEMLAVIKD